MMTDNFPKTKTVNILLLNIDDRQIALMRMAFKMHNAIHYNLVNKNDGLKIDMVLVDGDHISNENEWHTIKQKYTGAIVVFYGRAVPSFTAPYLAKPIKFETLFVTLRNLLQGNGVWVNSEENRENVNSEKRTDIKEGIATPFSQGVHDNITNTISESPNLSDQHSEKNHETVKIQRFYVDGTLLGLVKEVALLDKDMAITYENKPILIVFNSVKRVLLAADSTLLEKICLEETPTLHARPIATNPQLLSKAKITLDSCVWQLAIWTSKGRLIEPISPNTTLKLKAWPNMTRLTYLPESMRLAAFLVKSPVTLATLYKMLPVPMNDLLNFIAATYAIGVLEIEQPFMQANQIQELDKEVSLTRTNEEQQNKEPLDEKTKQTKGLLQRLMSRIRG